jgi:hypothetical protein
MVNWWKTGLKEKSAMSVNRFVTGAQIKRMVE